MQFKVMSNSNLAKPFSIQLTKDQNIALEILKSQEVNTNIPDWAR